MKSLPADASELSPAWLSEVLGAEVAAVEVFDHAFATNQRVRFGITYRTPGAGPASLFAKLAPIDAGHRAMIGSTGMAVREAQFYADVAPSVELRVPRPFFAKTSDDGLFAILLEDLSVRGCEFSEGEWGISADHAASALEDLARFHAHFSDPAVRAAIGPWMTEPPPPRMPFVTGLLHSVLDQHRDELTPDYVAAGELYVQHADRVDALWNGGPQTYIHGDTHIGNVFLDGKRVGFHDWGLSRVSTPLRDVSYFLTMSVDPEVRRRSERELLRTYLDALRAARGPAIGFDDAFAAHRVQAGYTVLATFLAFMPSYAGADGRGIGKNLLERARLALDDLEVVDAMRAALA